MQQRMDPYMRPVLEVGLKLIPEFRRLILHVPFHVFIPGTKVPLFRTGWLFIAANTNNHAGKAMFLEDLLEPIFLEHSTTFDPGSLSVWEGFSAAQHLFVFPNH